MNRAWRVGLEVTADLVDDILTELSSRRLRALLLVLAVGLSTGALLASSGISHAAGRQIGADIAASALDLVELSITSSGDELSAARVLPDDTEERLARVDLVEDGGRRLDVSNVVDTVVTRLPNGDPLSGTDEPLVVAMTSGYLRAARTPGNDSMYFQMDDGRNVAFLGRSAAKKLDIPITQTPMGLQVWIDGSPFDVIGFVGPDGPAALGHAVVVPYSVGLEWAPDDRESTVLIRTLPGAGARVARNITKAVRPDTPERLRASSVASVDSLRRGVSTQMSKLAGWTGAVLLSLTILLIANSMVVSVMARTPEIGLRRALGASRKQVAGLFLAEGALIGLLGGLVGAAVGTTAVVVTAIANAWSVALEPEWVLLGPLIGAGVGLVASAYPARRAAQVEPALAVRSV